jgi:dTDP-4-amino-4,6-dideoxygalactose transaminase
MDDIPFHKPYITEDEIEGVVDSLRSGWWTMGPKTVAFEQGFGRYVGAKHAVAVNSCTAALHLALKAVDLRPSDEVIIPDMTFTATGEVVCYFGAKPVVVDVEPDTLNIGVAAIEKAITPKTRAIIPVHFGGQPCDMDEILALARNRGLHVIEDAAHAIPAWYRGRKVGVLGDITCFSFYATKTLATGEGGMAATEHDEWAGRMKTLRLHGISKDAWKRYSSEGSWHYEVIEAGYKYNMTDIQSALGLAQLKKVEWMWERRKEIAASYTRGLSECGLVQTPQVRQDRVSAWHLYVIRLKTEAMTIDRSAFIEKLKEQGISTSVHFIPLHCHPFYRDAFGCRREQFPAASHAFERIISLPIYPGMRDADVERVIHAVRDTAERNKR